MDIEPLLRTLVTSLESAQIPYMITGSFASSIHGEPRATRDLDMVIDPEPSGLKLLVADLPTDRFYVNDALAALEHRDMFNIIDLASGWKVDLIIRKNRPFSRSELARRIPATIAGIETWISTPEDAILSKLEWQTISKSDVQQRDVVEMLLANFDHLDRSYLDQWAEDLGVTDSLALAWESASDQR